MLKTLLALSFMVAVLACATPGRAEDLAAAYNACLTKQREKKTEAAQKCVMKDGDERTACDAEVENQFSSSMTQEFCKLQSGVYLARDVNTVQESERLAQDNKERAKQAGAEEEAPKLVNRPLVTNKYGAVPLPPSRPNGLGGGSSRPGPINPDPEPEQQDPSPSPAKREAKNNPNPNQQSDPAKKTINNGGDDSRRPTNNGPTESTADKNTIYDNVSLAQSEAQMDVQSCQSKQDSASLCCNNPLACASAADRDVMQKLNAGPGDDAGLTQYCQQMQSASNASGSINSRLAATCTNNQYACSNGCANLEQKYRGYMASCENCESYSVFMNAANQLASARSACGQLQAKGDQLTAQSMSTASSSAYAQYCQQQAGTSPQSLTPAQAAAKAAAAKGAASASVCAYNPSAPGCAQATTIAAPEQGQGGFGTAAKSTNKNSFALQDLADSGFPGMKVDSALNAPPTVRAIPNGGGGGFGGGGTGGGATLGSSPRGANRVAGPSAGPSTEVERGFRSGGYSQPVGSPSAFEPSGYDGDRKPTTRSGTLDLKQYLPGGSLAPVRRLAGTNLRSEINAKEEDIFRRISLKIYEKCRLGILWRCD